MGQHADDTMHQDDFSPEYVQPEWAKMSDYDAYIFRNYPRVRNGYLEHSPTYKVKIEENE